MNLANLAIFIYFSIDLFVFGLTVTRMFLVSTSKTNK